MADEGTIITKVEDEEIINVEWKQYFTFLREGHTWFIIFFISSPLIGAACWCWMTLQYLTAEWMSHIEDENSFSKYFWKFLSINFINIFCLVTGFFLIRIYCLFISNRYFRKMAVQVIKAPLNLYFDTTPSGWILNRFSKDV